MIYGAMSIPAIIGDQESRAHDPADSRQSFHQNDESGLDSCLAHRLSIRSEGRVILVDEDDISFIRAEANYVRIFAGNESYRFRRAIGSVLEKLDSRKFARVHRSIIVNLTKIKQLQPCNSGEFLILLRDGTTLPSSRKHKLALRPLLERTL
jgi:two-component system LytT family response regulator